MVNVKNSALKIVFGNVGKISFYIPIYDNTQFILQSPIWLASAHAGVSLKGVKASAIVYTMIEMVRVHELNIYKYLNFLLGNLPSTKMTDTALEKLTP